MIWENKTKQPLYKMSLSNAIFDYMPPRKCTKLENYSAIITDKGERKLFVIKDDEDGKPIIEPLSGVYTIYEFQDSLLIVCSTFAISNDKKKLFNLLRKRVKEKIDYTNQRITEMSVNRPNSFHTEKNFYQGIQKNVQRYFDSMRTKLIEA